MPFTPILSAIILIFILGVLITAHEWGHFIMARLTGVRVNEFAIGMGPVIWSRQKKDRNGEPMGTKFSLRALPIGGFCAMEGEDEDSSNPEAFNNRPRWARFLVLSAGSVMNFILGLVLLIFIFGSAIGGSVVSPKIEGLMDGFPLEGEQGLMAGDQFLNINGHAIFSQLDVAMFLSRGEGQPYTITVRRDGKTVKLENLPLERRQYESGKYFGFTFAREKITVLSALKYSWFNSVDYVRLVWISLGDLISGRTGLDGVMGPVGMGNEINNVVASTEEGVTFWDKLINILQMAALISVNLAVMNMLPLPALDGGRILFVGIEAVRRKPVNPKYEGYIHAAGMLLFFALMFFVFFNDIYRLVTGSSIGT